MIYSRNAAILQLFWNISLKFVILFIQIPLYRLLLRPLQRLIRDLHVVKLAKKREERIYLAQNHAA